MAVDPNVQRAYTAVLRYFIEHGHGPHFTELASSLDVPADRARDLVRAASELDRPTWLATDTDYIETWAPFSSVPTQYRVSIDGDPKGYAMCGIEALAVRWMFPGREVRVDVRCLDCAEPFAVTMHDERVRGEPTTVAFHSNNPWSQIMTGAIGLPFA